MHLSIGSRQSRDCEQGTSYYVCQSSGYTGCCSVNACRGGCPDEPDTVEPSVTITASLRTANTSSDKVQIITAATVPGTRSTLSSTTASSTTQSDMILTAVTHSPTSSLGHPTTFSTYTFSTTSSTPSGLSSNSSIGSTSESAADTSAVPITAIVAGSVSGAVVLVFFIPCCGFTYESGTAAE